MTITLDGPLFKSAQDALTYALHYSHNQSPVTPMSRMLKGSGGTGKGLSGIDGAHQAGTIMQAMAILSPLQRAVIVVRFGDVRNVCPCCGRDDAPTREWSEAVDLLSHAEEIADLHPKIRRSIVEKIVCRRRMMRVAALASRYETTERTIRRRIADVKPTLVKLESSATALMQDRLSDGGVVG